MKDFEVRKESVFLVFSHSEIRCEGEGHLERARGCNGREHVDTFHLLFYGEDGEVNGGEYRGTQRVGACDHSCADIAKTGKQEDYGAFLYPVPGEGPDYRTHRSA